MSDIDPGPRVRGVPFSRSRAATQMSLKIAVFLILWSLLPPPPPLLRPLPDQACSWLLCCPQEIITPIVKLHQSPLSPELHLPPIRRCAGWLLATASLNSLLFTPKVSVLQLLMTKADEDYTACMPIAYTSDMWCEYKHWYSWVLLTGVKLFSNAGGTSVAHNVSENAQLMCGDIELSLPYGLWITHNECAV